MNGAYQESGKMSFLKSLSYLNMLHVKGDQYCQGVGPSPFFNDLYQFINNTGQGKEISWRGGGSI